MEQFLEAFADAMYALNNDPNLPAHRRFSRGIGPYNENGIVDRVMAYLEEQKKLDDQKNYVRPNQATRKKLGIADYNATPDLVIGNKIIEFKIARPVGNNGQRAENWFNKVFEPNEAARSAMSDVIKLTRHKNLQEIKLWEYWIVIIGIEREHEIEFNLDGYFPSLYNHISNIFLNRPFTNTYRVEKGLGNVHTHLRALKLYAFQY